MPSGRGARNCVRAATLRDSISRISSEQPPPPPRRRDGSAKFPREASNAQRQQSHRADAENQHDQRDWIVIKPMSTVCRHDLSPYLTPTTPRPLLFRSACDRRFFFFIICPGGREGSKLPEKHAGPGGKCVRNGGVVRA